MKDVKVFLVIVAFVVALAAAYVTFSVAHRGPPAPELTPDVRIVVLRLQVLPMTGTVLDRDALIALANCPADDGPPAPALVSVAPNAGGFLVVVRCAWTGPPRALGGGAP